MSQIIIAPDKEPAMYTSVFLAGGITKCKDWQKEVMDELKYDTVSIFNPRQEHFDITNPNASFDQIAWEFERLEQMDIFSMYFCESESIQPICMYELGRNVVRMQNRFPHDWQKRIVVSTEPDYSRKQDVIIQMSLCAPEIFVDAGITPQTHAQYIRQKLRAILYKSILI